jgi:hypothetical protein
VFFFILESPFLTKREVGGIPSEVPSGVRLLADLSAGVAPGSPKKESKLARHKATGPDVVTVRAVDSFFGYRIARKGSEK